MNITDQLNAAFVAMRDPLRDMLKAGYSGMTGPEIEALESMLREKTHVLRFLLDTSPQGVSVYLAPVTDLAEVTLLFHVGEARPAPKDLH